jgi:glycine/D-amino acid oxidase-like deaminating enzyme
VGSWRTRSLWTSRAGSPGEPEPLEGTRVADVVVVGAGFTGLWAALALVEADPALEVVVLEAKAAGYGASGRNGGFAMTMVGRNLHDLLRKVGPTRARATHLAMREQLHEIRAFCDREGIACDLQAPGLLTVSNGPEQDHRIRQDLEAAKRLGLDDLEECSGTQCRALVDSPRIRLGHFEQDCLLVDPAALCLGLREAARRRGVRVHEASPVLSLAETPTGVRARTPAGEVHADRAVLATNAYAAAVPALRRFLFTVYAYIVVSEPLDPGQWARVGWSTGVGVEDKRIMPHFHRPTPDGRILWGGRDAPIAFGPPDPRRDRDPRVFRRLEESFRWAFPQLADVAIVGGWGGPVCGTVNCFATVGFLGRRERICYALGYAGHGVAQSRLAGLIVRDLLLEQRTERCELPLVTKAPVPLPPEPLGRWLVGGAQRVLQEVDDRQDDRPALARLALAALE